MNKKEEIIKAARAIFARKGYHDASMEEIAGCANVAKGTLYLYFKDKDDLFTSVVLDMIQSTDRWIEMALEKEAGTWERVEIMVTAALEFFSQNTEVFAILQRETPVQASSINSSMNNKIKTFMKTRVDKLAAFFAAHRESGEISEDFTDRDAAFLCLNTVEGIVRRFLEGWEDDPEKNAALAVRFLKNGLGSK